MSTKTKILIAALGGGIGLLAVLYLKSPSVDQNQSQALVQEQLRAFSLAVQKETDLLKNQLIKVVEKKEAGIASSEINDELGPFVSVILLKFSPEGPQVRWQIDKSQNSPWSSHYLDPFFKKIVQLDWSLQPLFFGYLPSPQGDPFFQLSLKAQLKLQDQISATEVVIFAVFKEAFSGLLNAQKTGMTDFAILNNEGVVVTHSQRALRGKSLALDPFFEKYLKNPRPSLLEVAQDKEGHRYFKGVEMVPGGNLLTHIEVPFEVFGGSGEKQERWSLLLLGAGLMALALWLLSGRPFFWKSPPLPKREETRQLTQKSMPTTLPEIALPDVSNEISNEVSKEKHEKTPVPSENSEMQAYTQLSSALINEMKSPLLTILGYTQIAKSKTDDEATKNHYDLIEKEARQTKELIDKLGLFAGLGHGAREEFFILDLVQDVVRVTRPWIEEKEIRFEVKVPDHLKIQGQRAHLRLALSYLLENAIDSLEGVSSKSIVVHAESSGENILLEIEDSGEGISESLHEKVFEPFFSTRPGKKGLGLSSAAGIIKHHFGKIEIKKNEPRGTLISIQLPKKQPLLTPAQGTPSTTEFVSNLGLDIEDKLQQLLIKAEEALSKDQAPVAASIEVEKKAAGTSEQPEKINQVFSVIQRNLQRRTEYRELSDDDRIFSSSDESDPLILLDYLEALKSKNLLEVTETVTSREDALVVDKAIQGKVSLGPELESADLSDEGSQENMFVIENDPLEGQKLDQVASESSQEKQDSLVEEPLEAPLEVKPLTLPPPPSFNSQGQVMELSWFSDEHTKKEVKKLAKPRTTLTAVRSKTEELQVHVRRPLGKV